MLKIYKSIVISENEACVFNFTEKNLMDFFGQPNIRFQFYELSKVVKFLDTESKWWLSGIERREGVGS